MQTYAIIYFGGAFVFRPAIGWVRQISPRRFRLLGHRFFLEPIREQRIFCMVRDLLSWLTNKSTFSILKYPYRIENFNKFLHWISNKQIDCFIHFAAITKNESKKYKNSLNLINVKSPSPVMLPKAVAFFTPLLFNLTMLMI